MGQLRVAGLPSPTHVGLYKTQNRYGSWRHFKRNIIVKYCDVFLTVDFLTILHNYNYQVLTNLRINKGVLESAFLSLLLFCIKLITT